MIEALNEFLKNLIQTISQPANWKVADYIAFGALSLALIGTLFGVTKYLFKFFNWIQAKIQKHSAQKHISSSFYPKEDIQRATRYSGMGYKKSSQVKVSN